MPRNIHLIDNGEYQLAIRNITTDLSGRYSNITCHNFSIKLVKYSKKYSELLDKEMKC